MSIYERLKNSDAAVIIFGKGKLGNYIQSLCERHGVKISAFCDNSPEKQGKTVEGVPIFDIGTVFDNFKKIIFIVGVTYSVEEISDRIKTYDNGRLVECLYADQFFDINDIADWDFDSRWKLEAAWYIHGWYRKGGMLYLKSLDYVITERCSLKCRECGSLMPFYERPNNFPLEDMKREIDRIADIYDVIFDLRILGGEPLLHPALPEFINYAGAQSKIMRIGIYTNGTIVPSDKLMEVSKASGITRFSISNYGKKSRRLKDVISKCELYGIEYELKDTKWWSRTLPIAKRHRSAEAIKKLYDDCCVKECITLLKGRLYRCPFIANGLNLHALPEEPNNVVDIFMPVPNEQLKQTIQNVIHDREYFSLCDYCSGRSYTFQDEKEKISAAEQTERPLPYQRFD